MRKQTNLFLILIIGSLTFLSFTTINNNKSDNAIESNILEKDLEAKKAILVNYYANLISNEIDRRMSESGNVEFDEKEMIANLVLLTEYGCAYSGENCSGNATCGVSMLWAETFGSGSWSGSNGGGCQNVITHAPEE